MHKFLIFLACIYGFSMLFSALFVTIHFDFIEQEIETSPVYKERSRMLQEFCKLFAVSVFIFIPLFNTIVAAAFFLWLLTAISPKK